MRIFKYLLIAVIAIFIYGSFTGNSYAQSTACGSCPNQPGKACTNWSPPGAVCTNGDWYCNSCAPCATPTPMICPDVGFGSAPGSYCGAACVSCGVTSDRYYDSNCNCVTTGTFSSPTYCTQMCPTPTVATPTASPPPTCPNGVCSSSESCSSCPADCGACVPPPTAPPPGPTCPNSVCSGGETCSTCPADCGVCPTSTPPTATPPTATPTTPPACNVPCTSSTYCQNAQDGCTVCIDKPGGGGKTCQKPPTPTPTTIPACNAPCTTNSYCQNAQDGCTVCTDKPGGGGKTCQKPPTPTPTATATPTPTPPFDEAMCKCDQLDFTSIALGMTTNITAYGKVTGTDTKYAKIPTMTFKFYQGNGTIVNEIQKATINTTVVEQTTDKVRYQAVWALNLPTSLDTTQTYRIQAKPDCSRKAAIFNAYPTSVVLAANDAKAPTSFWGRITSFFSGLFGAGNTDKVTTTADIRRSATPTLTQAQRRQLQLKTFTPATGISTDNCSFIKFNF